MGGGVSRFDETDWQSSSGKLLSGNETIDGSQPTSKYGTYVLHKRGVNQREYDVTDDQMNLLYTTRCIEGTLAWFDVLGPGLDQYLLRIQVDLSRRYWVIYRFGQPSYAGQFADMTATERLRQSRGEIQPCLYKKSCITVTWGRYHAIVNNYGPPPPKSDNEEDGGEETIEFDHGFATKPSLEITESPPKDKKIELLDLGWQPPVHDECKLRTKEDLPPPDWLSSFATKAVESTSSLFQDDNKKPAISRSKSSDSAEPSRDFNRSLSGLDQFFEDTKRLGNPEETTQQSMTTKLKSIVGVSSESNPDPLEGYLQLNKPILKCEEINSFMGQHQTMLIGSEEAKKLERETIKELGANAYNPNANLQFGFTEEATHKEEPAAGGSSSSNETYFPRMRKFANWVRTKSQHSLNVMSSTASWDAQEDSLTPTIAITPLEGFEERKKEEEKKMESSDPLAADPLSAGLSPLEQNPSAQTEDLLSLGTKKMSHDDLLASPGVEEYKEEVPTSPAAAPEEKIPEEPLVGFWSWENTMRVHKMKLHVAEGCDLALHVVLAIVTNQLRLERNVVVSTV